MLFSSLVLLIGLQSQLTSVTTSQAISSSNLLSTLIASSSSTNNNNSNNNINNNNNNTSTSGASILGALAVAPPTPTATLVPGASLSFPSNSASVLIPGAQLANALQQSQTNQIQANQNYVIKIFEIDKLTNLAYANIAPFNVTNAHEPRIELRYQSNYPYIELPENTKQNSVVAALVVNDPDSGASGETSLFIEGGNELNNFKIVSTQHSNTIQLANPLNKNVKSDYNLTIVARDHGTPPKQSSVNLVIKVIQATGSYTAPSIHGGLSSSSNAWESQSKPPVTDFMYYGTMLVFIFLLLVIVIIFVCALVQRPKGKKGPLPRTTTNTITRIHPNDHYPCLGLTNLSHNHQIN